MFVTTKTMLNNARENGYAIGAFNVENAEMVWAVIAAAEELKAPVILQTTSGTLKYLPPLYFAGMASRASEAARVPVALHLDHGPSFELAEQCLKDGYSSIMFDGSARPFEENIELTKKVCMLAGEKGIPVEGEIGIIGGKEDDTTAERSKKTDPAQAADFARRTGVSSLAIAVGTAHGFYQSEPIIDLALIDEARKTIPVPLVLHGASGLSDDIVRKAVELGMSKVNFATELRDVYTKAVRFNLSENPDVYDPKKYGEAARAAVKGLVMHKIKVCGSGGRG